jgi:hypothetical protein
MALPSLRPFCLLVIQIKGMFLADTQKMFERKKDPEI